MIEKQLTIDSETSEINSKVADSVIVTKSLYESDFNLWLETTVLRLQEGKFEELDIDNLIEEIEGMSKSQKDALESNLIRVMQHLLKWHYQSSKRSRSWIYSIIEHSRRINKALKISPSLKPYFEEVFDECYLEAKILAAAETGLKENTFPENNPFTKENILNVNNSQFDLD